MTESAILDRTGKPYTAKSATAPNLDPDFWTMPASKASDDVMKKPYAHHVWTHVCVRSISQNVGSLKKFLRVKKSQETVSEHNVLTLLDNPNQMQQRVTFFKTVLNYLLLPAQRGGSISGGQCFIIPWNTAKDTIVNVGKGEMPSELFPYPENYFEPWYGEQYKGRAQLKGWKFSIPGVIGSDIFFESSQIIRVVLPSPYDILKGISPFSPVAQAVDFDAKADIYNSDSFANSGRLDGQVSSEQFVDPEELKKIKAEWYKQYTGVQRHRVAFLSGGLKYEQYALSSTEMQYIEQEKWSRQKVLGAYGLNRIGAGDYEDINFATIREGRKMLWYDTYIPMDEVILDSLNGQWVNKMDQGKYELYSDYTKVPALQADLQERAKTGGILVTQMGYPPSLAARTVQLPLSEEDVEKWPHLDEKQEAAAPSFPSIPVDEKAIKKSVTRDYSGEYIERVLDPGERYFKKSLDRYFIDQRNMLLDGIDAWSANKKAITKTVNAWEFIPDSIRQDLELMKIYKPAAKNQIALEKKQIEAEFGRGIQWDSGDTRLQYWMNKRSVYMEEINTNTFVHAKDAIAEAIKLNADKTPAELAREIKKAVHDVYEVRLGRQVESYFDLGGMSSSQTIARTEMGAIASLTRADIFKSEGVEKIEWATSQDDRVRDSHAELDGVQVVYGEDFPGVGMRYPRDERGSAGEVINCRCAYLAVSTRGD